MSESMLRMENVTMQFGGVVAVNNLSLNVDKGEIVALIGPNGAGKTTAFNCITGVYQPTNGKVFFEDNLMVSAHPTGKMQKEYQGMNAEMYLKDKILDPTPDQITKLGIARTFQNIRIYPKMSVCENVTIGLNSIPPYNALEAMLRTPKVRRKEREAYEKAIGYLEMVGLKDLADQEAGSLPYGLQRKLEIARALATNPKLLFLDEPAAGMNTGESMELVQFLKQLHQETGLAIVLIEHHLEVVMEVCKNITVLNLGALLATGTPQEIQNNPQVIKAYLGERRQKR